MAEKAYRVQGMDCADEESALRNVLASRSGIDRLNFDLVRSRLVVDYDADAISDVAIREAVASVGLRATDWCETCPQVTLQDRLRLGSVAAGGLLLAAGGVLHFVPGFEIHSFILLCASAVTGGWFIARKGLLGLKRLSLDINFLMTVAAVGAIAIKKPFEGAAAMFLFSVAGLLESWTVDRARRAIAVLLDLTCPAARVQRDDGTETDVPVEEIVVGSRIVVRPGERLPLDGVVVEGRSQVNQAPITGEPMPVERGPGSEAFAGSINGSAALVIETTRRAEDTTLARIIHMVEEAQARKSPAEQWVTRFAAYYTPIVCAVAAGVAVFPWLFLGREFVPWFYRALMLLVIACPCALVISTPVSIVCGLTRAARDGVLIKGGALLEKLGRADCLAFDKTGTLTVGRPRASQVIGFNEHSEEDVLARAASVESRSEHALAKAILFEAARRGISFAPGTDFVSIEGKGAEATLANGRRYWVGSHRLIHDKGVNTDEICARALQLEREGFTVVAVGSENHTCGFLGLADEPRSNARQSISSLKDLGVKRIAMLTGDNRGTAEAIGRELGVDAVMAELLPAEKSVAVADLKAKGCMVAMVGDGINDAPALAAADVSIAMGGAGSDVAMEAADVVLMADDLSKVPDAMRLSRRTLNTIRVNIVLALVTKAIIFGLALAGRATLWAAVAADMGTSLVVIANSMRLLKSGQGIASAGEPKAAACPVTSASSPRQSG